MNRLLSKISSEKYLREYDSKYYFGIFYRKQNIFGFKRYQIAMIPHHSPLSMVIAWQGRWFVSLDDEIKDEADDAASAFGVIIPECYPSN